MLKKITIASLLSLLIGGCSWVKVSPEGAGVKSITAEVAQTHQCERLGQTHSQTQNKIVFVERSQRKQQEELVGLAKNEAVRIGGNSIVAQGEITEGRQTFIIYKCP